MGGEPASRGAQVLSKGPLAAFFSAQRTVVPNAAKNTSPCQRLGQMGGALLTPSKESMSIWAIASTSSTKLPEASRAADFPRGI